MAAPSSSCRRLIRRRIVRTDQPSCRAIASSFRPETSSVSSARPSSASGSSAGACSGTDGGMSWQNVSSGLANRNVLCLVVAGDGKTLFAGTASGVYQMPLS